MTTAEFNIHSKERVCAQKQEELTESFSAVKTSRDSKAIEREIEREIREKKKRVAEKASERVEGTGRRKRRVEGKDGDQENVKQENLEHEQDPRERKKKRASSSQEGDKEDKSPPLQKEPSSEIGKIDLEEVSKLHPEALSLLLPDSELQSILLKEKFFLQYLSQPVSSQQYTSQNPQIHDFHEHHTHSQYIQYPFNSLQHHQLYEQQKKFP